MKNAKSKALSIAAELEKAICLDGHIGLIMENPSEIAHLSPLEQLFYKAIRKDIQDLCSAHNRLWDSSKDATNPEASIVAACAAIERQVELLNDRMNDFLDDAFDNLSEKTIQAQKLNEKIAITLLSECPTDKAFLHEKSKTKKSA